MVDFVSERHAFYFSGNRSIWAGKENILTSGFLAGNNTFSLSVAWGRLPLIDGRFDKFRRMSDNYGLREKVLLLIGCYII